MSSQTAGKKSMISKEKIYHSALLGKENDITNLVTAGSNTTIDYNTSSPQNATGDYRYLASHQLITYGDPSYTLDAAVIDILSPTDKIEYGRTNPMCNNPQIKIQNTGYTNITTIKFEYWVNSSTNIQDYTWTGNLAFLETALITLPVYHLFSTDMLIKGNKFNVSIKSANAVADNYFFNSSTFFKLIMKMNFICKWVW